MSSADELRRMTADAAGFYFKHDGPCVRFDEVAPIITSLKSELTRLRPVVEAARRVVGAAALHGRRAYAIVDLRTALDALDAAEKGGRHEG